MAPPCGVKRERNDEHRVSATREKSKEKRARLFSQMQEVATRTAATTFRSADDLDDTDLQEIYRIADAAVLAHDDAYRPSPAVMEEFLGCIFKDWTSLLSSPETELASPLSKGNRLWYRSPNPVGEVATDKAGKGSSFLLHGLDSVSHKFCFCVQILTKGFL